MQGLNAMFIEVLLDQYMHSYLQGVETFFLHYEKKVLDPVHVGFRICGIGFVFIN